MKPLLDKRNQPARVKSWILVRKAARSREDIFRIMPDKTVGLRLHRYYSYRQLRSFVSQLAYPLSSRK